MIGVGIWLGTLGYALLWYGAKLWTEQPASFADAFSFTSPPPAASASSKGSK